MITLAIFPLLPNMILKTEATIPLWDMPLVEVAIVDGNLPALIR